MKKGLLRRNSPLSCLYVSFCSRLHVVEQSRVVREDSGLGVGLGDSIHAAILAVFRYLNLL